MNIRGVDPQKLLQIFLKHQSSIFLKQKNAAHSCSSYTPPYIKIHLSSKLLKEIEHQKSFRFMKVINQMEATVSSFQEDFKFLFIVICADLYKSPQLCAHYLNGDGFPFYHVSEGMSEKNGTFNILEVISLLHFTETWKIH